MRGVPAPDSMARRGEGTRLNGRHTRTYDCVKEGLTRAAGEALARRERQRRSMTGRAVIASTLDGVVSLSGPSRQTRNAAT